jgi:lactoylglutathione lyase/methylmalonyl-CoA/ethylmalonyl-CoA epimerase
VEKHEYVEAYNAECVFTKHEFDETPIELIIPYEGVLKRYNSGKGGIHHIALQVEDVEAVREEYEAKGLMMLEKKGVTGACGLVVNFLRPSFGAGILVEFVEDK